MGTRHTLAIKSNGTLWAWGSNLVGECGFDTAAGQYKSSPVSIGTAILSLSSQVFSSCSSVAHAAGAIGHPAAVYTRPDDYFTWNSTPSGTSCLWHPSVTVWRTKKIGHWHEIIAESFSHTSL